MTSAMQRQTSGVVSGAYPAPAPLSSPVGMQRQSSAQPWRGSSTVPAASESGEGGLLSGLKYLDAFPKQREEASEFFQRTTSGGIITLVSTFFMTLLFFSELRLFTKVNTTHELGVDTSRGEQMEINFDITFPRLPCSWVSIDAMDVSGELHLDVDHDVYKKRLTADGYTISDGMKHEVGPSKRPMPKGAVPVGAHARLLLEQQRAAAAAEQQRQEQQQQQEQGQEQLQGQGQEQQQAAAAAQQEKEAGEVKPEQGGEVTPSPAAAGNQTKDGKRCMSCYGAEDKAGDCCNTCEEVREAYRRKGWALLDYEGVEQCHGEGYLTEIKEQAGEGCHIWGKLLINKVAGNFHFAPGRSYQQGNMHIHDLSPFTNRVFDFSHQINKLAYGLEYPGMKNPLDGVVVTQGPELAARGSSGIYQYFLKVVPTRYTDLSNETVATNQFSVTEHVLEGNPRTNGNLPGLFFFYDLSPIKVAYQESRLSLLAFLTSVCAIVGGVFTVSGIIDATVYQTGRVLKKKMELGKLS